MRYTRAHFTSARNMVFGPLAAHGGSRYRPAVAMARATRLSVLYFIGATLALIWPIYGWFGNHIEPRVFGLPWSLTYVLLVIAANTAVLTALYIGRWADGPEDGDDDGEAP